VTRASTPELHRRSAGKGHRLAWKWFGSHVKGGQGHAAAGRDRHRGVHDIGEVAIREHGHERARANRHRLGEHCREQRFFVGVAAPPENLERLARDPKLLDVRPAEGDRQGIASALREKLIAHRRHFLRA